MASPAQQFLQKHYARLERGESNTKTGNAYELMLAKLNSDRVRLKKFQSTEAKIELKKELIPDYLPWINGVLEADNAQQDDVFMWIFVWLIDTKQFAVAYPLAEHVIKHDWVTPDEYQRQTATLIAEELANTVIQLCQAEQPVDVETLFKFDELLRDKDMFDEVRAKLNKALGMALETSDPEKALAYLERALVLDEKSGVKTKITALKKALNKADS